MNRMILPAALAVVCANAVVLYAQQPLSDVDQPPEFVLLQDEQQDQPTLPPVDVEAEAEPSDLPLDDALGQNFAYPSLADQTIGGMLDGGSRGPQMSLFDNPRAVDIITQQQLTERAPADLGQALEQSVGVMIQRTGRGQSSPYIRGLTGQQVLILVDGVRMTNATFRAGPNQYFNTIDPNMVERIEVIRGPGSVLYGSDAIGGVINVVTKKANYTGYNYATGGTIQRFSSADLGYQGRLNVEGFVGTAGVFAGGGYANYNDLDIGGNPDAPPGFVAGRQGDTSWRYNSADVKFNYYLNDCSELIFALQHFRAEDVFRSDRFPSNRSTIFDPQQRDLAYVRWQGCNPCGLINSYQVTASFQYTREDREERNPRNDTTPTFNKFTNEQTGISALFTTDLCCWGSLNYGVDWYHDEVDASSFNLNQGPPVTTTPGTPQFPNDSYYSRYGAFLEWYLPIADKLHATAGVRYEHIAAGSTLTVLTGPPPGTPTPFPIDPEYHDWIWETGLTYELTDCLHLVGSISEGFRAPNLDDLVATNSNVFGNNTQIPNPSLQPETSLTYEVGAKVNTPEYWLQTFVWWTDLQDFIVRQAAGAGVLQGTNATAYLQGVEMAGEYLFCDGWSVYGNFWYTYGINETISEPLSRIPPMQGIVGLRWRDDCGCNWFDVYAWLVDEQDRLAARDITDTNRIPPGGTPGYVTLNARAGRMISTRQRISLNVENIFDEQYRVHGSGSDGPGINAVLTYEFLQ